MDDDDLQQLIVSYSLQNVSDDTLEILFGGWPIMWRRVPTRGEN